MRKSDRQMPKPATTISSKRSDSNTFHEISRDLEAICESAKDIEDIWPHIQRCLNIAFVGDVLAIGRDRPIGIHRFIGDVETQQVTAFDECRCRIIGLAFHAAAI